MPFKALCPINEKKKVFVKSKANKSPEIKLLIYLYLLKYYNLEYTFKKGSAILTKN